ncbi:winged helix-turn-helix domain-containing protein [Sphingomonas sp.]|uniref:winged helix-turn-helix domain-containing protein n=1 Tax=Sphingomonas sp. TaxID=28214 RepID=UPI001B126446|nr:winged helix-turn-helix domain-containing protein [Sphingomonas sp.]MBO9711646.1 winged helix-turn-helix domain-containing protein [Sphingomonas sp.]
MRAHIAGIHSGRSSIRLGSVEVIPSARTVLVDGEQVELGGRAFDLLKMLLDARGEIVSKEELIRRVWPTVTVVESNLKVQLSLVRRALGPERWRIKTIAGRGYLLVSDDAATANDAVGIPARAAVPGMPLVIVIGADGAEGLLGKTLLEILEYSNHHRGFVLPCAAA